MTHADRSTRPDAGLGEEVDPATDATAEIALPALLRHARGAFARAIREELDDGGFFDLPANGPYVLGGMARHDADASQLLRELGISKQAASQLVDVLVMRGYLSRSPDPLDRRRVRLELTERGRAAALAVREGVEAIDAVLRERLSAAELSGLRRGLAELITIKEQLTAAKR